MEANVLLFKCTKAKQVFGVRAQKMEDNDWWRTWAFPLKQQNAQREGYDKTQVQGNLNATEGYPGCPHCGTVGFVQCGTCKKIACWDGEPVVICPWCNTTLDNIAIATDKFNVDGDQF